MGKIFRLIFTSKRLLALLIALTLIATSGGVALATLSGSTFESNDGNLDSTGALHDWNPAGSGSPVNKGPVETITCPASAPGAGANCGLDLVKNGSDNSLGQGSKEDDPAPTVVTGSIPPSKDDLSRFYVNKERAGGDDFLYLAWERSNLLGSAHMDFEFNQDSTPSANGVTPVRTEGDMLIDFDFGGSGVPVLAIHTWVTTGDPTVLCEASNTLPCWGKANSLDPLVVEAAVNSTPVKDYNPPNAPLTLAGNTKNGINSTFGEAGINLTDANVFPQNVCKHFGSAYLKSRSSGNSFTSELKDFIAPIPVDISNCGTVKIHKQDDLGAPLQGAVFTLYKDNAPVDGPAPHGVEDVATSLSCTTLATGDCSIVDVPYGDYWAVETKGVVNHDLAPDQSFSLTPDTTISLTFVDPRQPGAIKVSKSHKVPGMGDRPQAGVSFTVNGVTKLTDANGEACFDGLMFGSYTVHEDVPAGYQVDQNDKSVTVDNTAKCSDATYGGETVSFYNTPLTDITVTVNSQVDGGTASTIVCKAADGSTVASGTTGANGDGSASVTGLIPGTYTCTIVVDP